MIPPEERQNTMQKRGSRIDRITETLENTGLKMTQRSVHFEGGYIRLFFIQHLTNRVSLSDLVVKPLINYFRYNTNDLRGLKAREVMENVIYTDDNFIESDDDNLQNYILDGMTVLLLSTDDDYIVINLRSVEHRDVSRPEIEYTLRGPKDCFVENLDVNLSLIRYRIKDENLRINFFKVGKRTKTNVAVIYIADVANDNVVRQIQSRIERINVSGISESGELQSFLLSNKNSLFPRMGLVERSDMAYHLLTEGKVLIIVDGSGIALSAPRTFAEYFHSCDDRYDNKYFGMFMRVLRYMALFIAVLSSSLYVGITTFHMDAVPSEYTISLAEMRSRVPFSGLVGALLLEFLMELLREALLRVPKQIGPAVGIVGAIVIGQAATAAGIFSPLLLILVSAALMASFLMPDFSLINPFRILKFLALLFTGIFGFYGLILFISLILINLVSAESFGVPYLAPFAPYNFYDFVRSFINNTTTSPKRPKYLRVKDKKMKGS